MSTEDLEPPELERADLVSALTGLINIILSRVDSTKPEEVVGNLALLEEMEFLMRTNQDKIDKAALPASFEECERAVMQHCRRLSPTQRSSISKDIAKTTRRHVRGVKRTERMLRGGVLADSSDIEFDHDVFYLREELEQAFPRLDQLGFQEAVRKSKRRIRAVDPLLRRLADEALLVFSESQGYIGANPRWFPESFWWRRVAWKSYQRWVSSRMASTPPPRSISGGR